MKLEAVIQFTPALQALYAQKLPVKVSYRIARILNIIKPDMLAYEEARMGLFREFGVSADGGNSYSIPPEKALEFNEQFKLLVSEDLKVELPKIKISELGDLQIEPQHLMALDPLLIDDTGAE